MKTLIFAIAVLAISAFAFSANAEPKAYQFALDQQMSEVDCLNKASGVATENKLSIQSKDDSGTYGFNDSDGERAGAVYYSEGTCHIYIF